MRLSKFAAGLLVAAVLLFVIAFALREAGDFERISGVTRPDAAEGDATLRGAAGQPTGSTEQDLPLDDEGTADSKPGSWVVRGRVIDLRHRPVAGVGIEGGSLHVVSGEDGRFTIRTDRDPLVLSPSGDWEGGVIATRVKPQVTLQVIRTLPLEVTVLDDDGQPMAGITGRGLHSYTSGADRGSGGGHDLSMGDLRFGPTDETGRYVLHLAASTDYLRLEARHEGTFAWATIHFPFDRKVVLRLRQRLLIRGEVVDASGTRLEPRGTFVARSLALGQAIIRSRDEVWLEEDMLDNVEYEGEETGDVEAVPTPGPFEFAVAGSGPWLLHFEPAAPGIARSEAVLLTAPATDVRLVCPPLVNIRGRVLEVDTTRFNVTWIPAPGTPDAHCDACSVMTGYDGVFELWDLVAGPGKLFARHLSTDRYGLVEGLRAPRTDVRVPLKQGVALAGRVVGGTPPVGLEDAELWIQAVAGDLSVSTVVVEAGPFTLPEEVGTFRIGGLPPHRYALQWRWQSRWRSNWGALDSEWTPFPNAHDVDPAAGPLTLPGPR